MKIFGFEISWKGWGAPKQETKQLVAPPNKSNKVVKMPVGSGTITPSNVNAYLGTGELQNELSPADYRKLRYLAKYDHDVSYAVNNIVQMASTPYTIKFGSEVSQSESKKMMQEINEINPKLYEGGKVGLANAILRQCVITGAFSGEATPNDRLNGVKRVTLLEPERVLFVWERAMYDYVPYQVNNLTLDVNYRKYQPNEVVGYATRLNPLTYKYIPLDRSEQNPYAIPPFLSALEGICIENDMLENLSSVVRRMGLLGFLEVLLPAPDRDSTEDEFGIPQPESDDSYQNRMIEYLQQYAGVVENGLSKGYSIGLKRFDEKGNDLKHEFNMQNSTSNAQVAKPLMELIMTVKSAGLKQDPVFLGKNFSTTEALAKVLINKFAAQLQNYQDLASQFIAHVYKVHLLLRGYGDVNLEVVFEEPLLQDVKTKYEGLNAKFDIYQKMKYAGLINQQQFAQIMGLDAPAEKDTPQEQTANTQNSSFASVVDRQRSVVQSANYKAKKAVEKGIDKALSSFYLLSTFDEVDMFELSENLKREVLVPLIQITRDMVNKIGMYADSDIKQPELVIENVSLLPIFSEHSDTSNLEGLTIEEIKPILSQQISPYRSIAKIANSYKNIYLLNEMIEKSVEKFGINDPIGNECCKDSIYNVKEALVNISKAVINTPNSLLRATKDLVMGKDEQENGFICRCSVYSV